MSERRERSIPVRFNRKLFGSRCRAARLMLGLTQEDVAHLLGVTGTWISRVELGNERVLTVATLEEVANLLDVDPGSRDLWILEIDDA